MESKNLNKVELIGVTRRANRRTVNQASRLFDQARLQRNRLPIGASAVERGFKRKSIGRLNKTLYNISSIPDIDPVTLKFKTKIGEDGITRKLNEAIRDYYEERMERAGVDFRIDYTDASPEAEEQVATLMAAEERLQ